MRLVEPHEQITPDMFLRPLLAEADDRNVTEGWAGEPINSFLWVPVPARLGPIWFTRTVGDYITDVPVHVPGSAEYILVPNYEFAIDVPPTHVNTWAPPLMEP